MAFFQVYDARLRFKEEMMHFLEERRSEKEKKGLASVLADYHLKSQLKIQHQQGKALRAGERCLNQDYTHTYRLFNPVDESPEEVVTTNNEPNISLLSCSKKKYIIEKKQVLLTEESENWESCEDELDSGYDTESIEGFEKEKEVNNIDEKFEFEVPKKKLQGPYCKTCIPWETNKIVRDCAETLQKWVEMMAEKESKILHTLHKQFGIENCLQNKKLQERSLIPSIVKYKGKKDKKGRYNGQAHASYSNGSEFNGYFRKGKREGFGTLELLTGEKIDGEFINDKLEGWALEVYDESGWRETFYRQGFKVGYYRDISPCVTYVEFGTVGGRIWRLIDGKSLMIGEADSKGMFTGSNILYLYPGYELGLIGAYEKGKMKSARDCIPISLEFDEQGFPFPAVQILKNSRLLSYESPGAHIPAQNCCLRDLWDILHVYVGQSLIEFAGEGLFARRPLRKSSLVAVFNGARKRHYKWTNFEEFSDYCIGVDSSLSLDIPECYVNVKNYSATLAHKACHSFKPNAKFGRLDHPRFGKIMAIYAIKDLEQDDEILVSYNYGLTKAPVWYKNLWLQYLSRERGWSNEEVLTSGISAAYSAVLFTQIDARVQACRNSPSQA